MEPCQVLKLYSQSSCLSFWPFPRKFLFRDLTLVMVGLQTGFRIGELLSLNVGDVWDGAEVGAHVKVARAHEKGRARFAPQRRALANRAPQRGADSARPPCRFFPARK